MSGWLLVVAMVTAVNPWRARAGMGGPRRPAVVLAVGAVAGLTGVAVLAAVASGLLDALEITPETFLIAAGLVAIVAGTRSMLFPMSHDEPPAPGWREGLWPIAFPRILSAEVMALSLALVSQRGVGAVTGAAAIGIGALAGLGSVRIGDRTRRVLAAGGQVAGAMLCVAGIWMMIEGIRDV